MPKRISLSAIGVAALGASSPLLAQTASPSDAAVPPPAGAPAPAPAPAPPPAHAASGADPAQASQQQGGLEDIVVTAQRRSERMQDVPISVTTLSTRELTSAGVAKTDALVQVTPGLVMNRQLSGAVPYLRGVGNPSVQPGVESPVPTYVDGVYYSEAVGNVFSFNNVKQVEILKGPQGTLFGRNATGGLINVITRDPSAKPSLEGSIGYGNFHTLQGNLYATGGSDTLAADIALYGNDQMRGFGHNLITGADVNRDREVAVRSKVLWTPSANDRITLSGDWSRDRTDLGTVLGVVAGGVGIDRSVYANRPYDSRNNYPDTVKIDSWGLSGRYERNLGFGTLSSITAYRNVKYLLSLDQDGTPVPLVNVNVTEGTHTFQQEFLLVGHSSRFDWTAGLFYFFASNGYMPLMVRSPIVPPLNFDTRTLETTRSYAGYAQGTYRIGDLTRITLGARYTVDHRHVVGQQTSAAGKLLASADASARFPKLTYRLAIDHKVTPDVLIYASYDRGFKSGLFATGSVSSTPVQPETLDAYQAGLKSDLFDRTLRLNLSGFYYDYKNIQLNRVENGAGILLNAAKGRSYGGEIEATFVPRVAAGNLQFNANMSLLDAKYTSFPNGPIFTVNPLGGNVQSAGDLSGKPMIRAPRWTLSLGVDYSVPVGSGALEMSANYYHSAQFNWEPDGNLRQPAYDVVNAQIGYAFGPERRYRIRLWGKNLTNRLYYVYAVESALGKLGDAAPPRTYGAAFDFKF